MNGWRLSDYSYEEDSFFFYDNQSCHINSQNYTKYLTPDKICTVQPGKTK